MNLYLYFSEKSATPIPQIRATTASACASCSKSWCRVPNGKLTLKVIDPQPYSEEEDRANELGISSVADQRRAARSSISVSPPPTPPTARNPFAYLDPQSEEQLEYDVAKLIHKLSSAKKPVVGWLSSLPMQGDFDMQTGRPRQPWVVYGQVEQLYTCATSSPRSPPSTMTSTCWSWCTRRICRPRRCYAIDQFALRGGRVLAFVDPNAQADHVGAGS